jgi:hypothetical protein
MFRVRQHGSGDTTKQIPFVSLVVAATVRRLHDLLQRPSWGRIRRWVRILPKRHAA